jgi:hypothetical protein
MESKVEGRRPKGREWMLALGSVAAGVGLVAAVEAGLRVRPPAFLERTRLGSPIVYSPVYGWELRRSWRGRDASGAAITLDAHGRRLTPAPPTGVAVTRRVVMLGDSIAFGPGVADQETFSHQLHELDPALEVVNLAVPGYGTDQALLRLQREGAALAPDVVVLHFCLANDFVDNALSEYLYDPRRPKPYFTLEGGELRAHADHLRQPWRVRLASALQERSYLINALSGAREREGGLPPETGHFQQREKRVMRALNAAADLTAREIAEVDALSRRLGARLILLVHPDRSSFEGESELAELVAARTSPTVRAVDLRFEYLALDLGFWDVALDRVGHLNPRGHAVVARVLHRLVTEERANVK